MEDVKLKPTMKSRWIVIAIRTLMCVLLGSYLVVIALSWGLAALGEREQLVEWIDYDFNQQLETWQIMTGFLLDLLPAASLAGVSWCVHRFFVHFENDRYFDVTIIRTIHGLGFWLGSLWFTFYYSGLMYRFLIEPASSNLRIEAIDFVPLDIETIFLFLGLVFVAMASVLDEARMVDEENKEIV